MGTYTRVLQFVTTTFIDAFGRPVQEKFFIVKGSQPTVRTDTLWL